MTQFVISGLKELEDALAKAPQEIKRAARNALNDTARRVQADVRATLPGKFDIRKKTFINRQIKTGGDMFATKEKLEAKVALVGPAGQDSTLQKFEDRVNPGKLKKARSGTLAVPAADIRTRGGHVKPQWAWNKLTPLGTAQGRYNRISISKKRGVRYKGKGRTTSSKRQIIGKRGTFVVRLKTGFDALVVRRRGGDRGLDVKWIFKPQVSLPPSLGFQESSRGAAFKWLPIKATEAVEHAMRRAKLK